MKPWAAWLGALCLAAGIDAVAQPPAGPGAAVQDRGALLYSTHCVGCHSTQVHWRDAKRVADWAGLLTEVRRWQSNNGLAWSDDDVAAVARHLNARYYHFPEPARVADRAPVPR